MSLIFSKYFAVHGKLILVENGCSGKVTFILASILQKPLVYYKYNDALIYSMGQKGV